MEGQMFENGLPQERSPIIQPQKPIIEFRGVSKTYATGTHALNDVNVQIHPGEFVH